MDAIVDGSTDANLNDSCPDLLDQSSRCCRQ
jgi:hypothetical protein